MRRYILTIAVVAIMFVGCGSDNGITGAIFDVVDDVEETTTSNTDTDMVTVSCRDCVISSDGIELDTQFCDNGDGTITQVFQGVSTTFELPFSSFDEFINITIAGGTTRCN